MSIKIHYLRQKESKLKDISYQTIYQITQKLLFNYFIEQLKCTDISMSLFLIKLLSYAASYPSLFVPVA
ncbi:IS4 transposase [Nostoc flagelliforme CCNUN1]|uniref:IS4 transposase n=1 Tax=Nostoc flagelliforme CCNUN1 TaxID=2038116 RepID=A0A2K8T406_9NOSO|nr:IS4 transposase [Nostoc flagelliforme CCNUN1]